MLHLGAAVYLGVAAVVIGTSLPGSLLAVYPVVFYAHAKWLVRQYPCPIRDPKTGLYTHKRHWSITAAIIYSVGLWIKVPVVVSVGAVLSTAAASHNAPPRAIPPWAVFLASCVPVMLGAIGIFQLQVATQIVLILYAISIAKWYDQDDRFSSVAPFSPGTVSASTPHCSQSTRTKATIAIMLVLMASLPIIVHTTHPMTRLMVLMLAHCIFMIPNESEDNLYMPLLMFTSCIAFVAATFVTTAQLPVWAPVCAVAAMILTNAGVDHLPRMDARKTATALLAPVVLGTAAITYAGGSGRDVCVLTLVPVTTFAFNLLYRVDRRSSIQRAWIPVMMAFTYIITSSVIPVGVLYTCVALHPPATRAPHERAYHHDRRLILSPI